MPEAPNGYIVVMASKTHPDYRIHFGIFGTHESAETFCTEFGGEVYPLWNPEEFKRQTELVGELRQNRQRGNA